MTRNVDSLEEAVKWTKAAIYEIGPDSDADADDEPDDQVERELVRLNTTLIRTE